ncbi:GNAT family N-acetyltransferase [Bacillus mycoides]|nr:GNAT family N-acetyltransferase [Bacillus mycoides]
MREGGGVMHVSSILKIEEVASFIATTENSRRKGVGERLLQGAIQYIFSFQGMREIELCLNTNNVRAMKLYKKVGFEEKACLQHYIIE